MVDVVDPLTRSQMMACIRGKNTKPEILIRKGLHGMGYRYRIHGNSLPGRPDIVFFSRRAVIQIHGCFWHLHDCPLFKWPTTRPDFWRLKLERNRNNDIRATTTLSNDGWRILTIWECALKGRNRQSLELVLEKCAAWLGEDSVITQVAEIRGTA